MTKEELEKEAREWSFRKKYAYGYSYTFRQVINAYIDSAEPREKQIQIGAEHIRALQKQNGELTDRVRELEAQIEKMKCCYNCKHSRTDYVHCITNKHEKWEIKEK